ncbi:putative protein OS=Tsukamurella paurometabola (strain ATCC 8368 / DSM / CCUG 35730 /CIP 100753 / JCM 10117 / KCTC 9821 / NBRC 16120 / NCIMB 702349/ NCTC 13040) OX=521096 GN=Tpau_2239 PE=4 SV=1 [Tsukamurella paurometabola]|nr:hypothetical protein [Tsukamurella paurometabola]SUP33317.1 Uncharacterised protein [Tsukamurella paurometabola]
MPEERGAMREGAWVEAIGLFSELRDGRQRAALRLIQSAARPDDLIGDLMSLLGVLVRGLDPAEVDRFLDAAYAAGPPPRFGARPELPPLS